MKITFPRWINFSSQRNPDKRAPGWSPVFYLRFAVLIVSRPPGKNAQAFD